jgi:tRNA(Ile)-lysidine synthase
VSDQERVEREVRRAIERNGLWSSDATLVVAVSGGADSLCLLGTLLSLQARGYPLAPSRIIVAHLDHCLRGEQGADDARWVATFAQQHGLASVVERSDVATLAHAEHRSLEEAARRARYAFLRRVAQDAGADRICVGHTRDDQAETLAMSWLRGSGLAGLAGMAHLERDIARPLLDLTRADTVAYCAARGWQPREDATNADTTYLRNRIRHDLLPLLEAYNPALRRTLARNAAIIAEDERFLEAETDRAWAQTITEHAPSHLTIDLASLRAQPLALRRRLVRRAVYLLTAYEHALEARQVAQLDRLIAEGATGAALDLPGRIRARVDYTMLVVEVRPRLSERVATAASEAMPSDALPLPVPGAVALPALGWRVRAWQMEQPPGLEAQVMPRPAPRPFANAGTTAALSRAEMRVYLDSDAAGDSLYVRTWRPGDRFRPMGMRHEKKLQDYFADAKVPRPLRATLPLVFGRDHLLWVGGQRIDDRARLTPQTQRVLVLQLEPLEDAAATLELSQND